MPTQAQTTTTDWGVIPLEDLVTIVFANQDLTKNFTDQYTFTLNSGSETMYEVVVSYDTCTNGCGNATIDYALYDATGQLVDSSGSVILASGDYTFQVRGTGLGSGNELSYDGTITFNASNGTMVSAFVSPVPEPAPLLLGASSLLLLAAALWRHRHQASRKVSDPLAYTGPGLIA